MTFPDLKCRVAFGPNLSKTTRGQYLPLMEQAHREDPDDAQICFWLGRDYMWANRHEQGIELLPILAQMSGWGFKYLAVSEELGIRAKLLSEGGPKMWAEFMDELRELHLGIKRRHKTGPSVGQRLQTAYEKVMKRK